MIDPNLAYTIGAGLLGGAVAWGGVLQSVKGLKETATDVKNDLAKHTEKDQEIQSQLLKSLSRIEGALGIGEK